MINSLTIDLTKDDDCPLAICEAGWPERLARSHDSRRGLLVEPYHCVPTECHLHDALRTFMKRLRPSSSRLNIIVESEKADSVSRLFGCLDGVVQVSACAIQLRESESLSSGIYRGHYTNFSPECGAKLLVCQPSAKVFSPFSRLPAELQAHIVSFASLASPTTRLATRPSDQVSPIPPLAPLPWSAKGRFAQPQCCGNCSGFYPPNVYRELDDYGEDIAVCYCHTSHNSFSTTCTCVVPPRSLFTMSRHFGRSAEDAFFRNNNFVVNCFGYSDPTHLAFPVLYSNILGTQSFLASIPRSQHKNIRNIHLRLYAFDIPQVLPTDIAFATKVLNTLQLAIGYLSRYVSMQRLNLTIDLTPSINACWDEVIDHFDEALWPSTIVLPHFTARREALYLQLGQAVADILLRNKPRNLWFYLAWPLPPLDNERLAYEKQLERMTIGEVYDSVASGKAAFEPWLDLTAHGLHALCLPGGCIHGRDREVWLGC